ncbi:MAG: hypothetical protein ABI885_29795 [Gammaproteobacteria bacterium]
MMALDRVKFELVAARGMIVMRFEDISHGNAHVVSGCPLQGGSLVAVSVCADDPKALAKRTPMRCFQRTDQEM